jgi:hypothetical protein
VYSLLTTDTGLKAVFGLASIASNIAPVNGLDDAVLTRREPFVLLKWNNAQKAFKNTGMSELEVWVYDFNPSYARIDRILESVRTILTSAVHVLGADGVTFTYAEWSGDTPDLYDDAYQASLKTSTFLVLGR